MERDVKFITDFDNWPRWPVLPLKRRSGKAYEPNYCGFIIASNHRPIKVYLGTIFDLKSGNLKDVVAGMPTEEYVTPYDLVKEWTVD